MKNNLYEKYQSPKVDDNSNPNKGIPIRSEEPEEPSKFIQFLKYSLIIACCIGIPFYMNSDSDQVVEEMVASFKDGFNEKTTVTSSVAPEISNALPPLVSSILTKTVSELKKAAANPEIDAKERANLKEAIAKIESKINVEVQSSKTELNEASKLAIEDALAELEVQLDEFDENELNATLNKSLSSALQGLEALNQLENLESLKSLEGLSVLSQLNGRIPPVPPVPPISGFNTTKSNSLEISYLDYLAELKENGLFNTYKEYELKSFYDNGVDVDQILEWKENGLTDLLKPWELTHLYNNDIDASEMNPWIKGGFLKDYKSHEIIQFIKNDVTPEHVSDFKKNGLAKKYKFYEITNFFNADVTIDDLKEWDATGYLDLYKSHEILNFIENDVPPSFLRTLDDKGLLKDLKFYEITKLYNESEN
ncbi:MAG: hypothetical protein GW809_00895 [Bacteroidetes bacterium]|nr:hypothetical protein [Bacteroidota bacterium]